MTCEIINSFFDVPVVVGNRRCSAVSLDMRMGKESGIILFAEPALFTISNECESDKTMIKYMQQDFKSVAELYHPKLVGILHELGHAFTMVGVNYKKVQRQKKYISNNEKYSFEKANQRYRLLQDESRADQWAINWLIANPELARRWSNDLIEEFPIQEFLFEKFWTVQKLS